jgi:hypothetical protein
VGDKIDRQVFLGSLLMNSPFLLIEGGDLNFFRTLHGLTRYVESPDIDAYLAVDSAGLKVELTAEPPQGDASRFGLAAVVPVKASVTGELVDQAMLRDRLVNFLRSLQVEVDEGATLRQVWEMAVNKTGFVD